MSIVVLGAGVAGLSAALYLRRAGLAVTVLDPLGPAGGASFGNAGLLSPQTVVPLALPGMLRKVPGWLRDPLGPLTVRPSYAAKAMPWLMRWVNESRMARVLENAKALKALHAPAMTCWRELLGEEAYRDLIRETGQVQVWEGDAVSPSAAVEADLRERHGIKAEALGADELRQIFPGLARSVTRGLLVPGNGHTVNPARLVQTLAALFQAEGGTILPERAEGLIPTKGGAWLVMSNHANHRATQVLVAGGAWSGRLLEPLGIRLPLEAERGYHAHLFDPSVTPRLPIMNKTVGFGLTPMEDGLRAAGTVEFAGLEAAPDERRAMRLAENAKRLFPDLAHTEARFWLGRRPSFPDSLPVLGGVASRPGLFLCFGHGHFGMTAGPPSGRIVACMMQSIRPEIDPAPYSAARFGVA